VLQTIDVVRTTAVWIPLAVEMLVPHVHLATPIATRIAARVPRWVIVLRVARGRTERRGRVVGSMAAVHDQGLVQGRKGWVRGRTVARRMPTHVVRADVVQVDAVRADAALALGRGGLMAATVVVAPVAAAIGLAVVEVAGTSPW
jgi:hypothetical protein